MAAMPAGTRHIPFEQGCRVEVDEDVVVLFLGLLVEGHDEPLRYAWRIRIDQAQDLADRLLQAAATAAEAIRKGDGRDGRNS